MNFTALLDVDGLLCDCVRSTAQYHDIPHFFDTNPHCRGDLFWAYFELQDFTERQFFSLPTSFWAEALLCPEAFDIIDVCRKHFGDRLVLCTSPVKAVSSEFQRGRTLWLHNNFPDLAGRVIFIDRKELLADSSKVLVDDSPHNVLNFREAGGQAILFPRPWNSNYELEPQCCDYLDAELSKLLTTPETANA